MGMVHALQTGNMPLSKASPRIREVATSMHPKDVTEFAATKAKGLPEHVPAKKDGEKDTEKKSALVDFGIIRLLVKQADISSILDKTRKSVHSVGETRRKHLESEVKMLRNHSSKLQQQLQKAQMSASSATAAANAMPPQMPAPPPAQAAYGAMLMPPQEPEKKSR